jgi:hypothetical protein
MDAKRLEIQGRRVTLPTRIQRECRRLDTEIPAMERKEKSAHPASLAGI